MNTIKLPKNFNKMNLNEQEQILVKRLLQVTEVESDIRKLLAKVRGGQKVELIVDERFDFVKE